MFDYQKKHITILLLSLLSFLTMGFWSSCDKYNSESVGSQFYPANSLVRLYTHPVYVEFSQDGARVWGPYTDEVDYSVDGTHVSLKNVSDSLALFVYGYPSLNSTSDCSIVIESDRHFALYLNKLTLRSFHKPAIQSTGSGTCYLVLPKNSKNELYSMSAPATFEHHGTLVLTGEGELTINNEPLADSSGSESLHPVGLDVRGGLHCQYDLKLSVFCPAGDAIRVSNGPMRSSLGKWTFDVGQHAISNLSDSIVLIAGTYTGVAREGKFFDNAIGAVIRQAKVEGLSGQASDLLDTLILHQRYDSTQVTLQQQFDAFTVHADSVLNVALKRNGSNAATFNPRFTIAAPWVVLSNPSLQPTDTLIVAKK